MLHLKTIYLRQECCERSVLSNLCSSLVAHTERISQPSIPNYIISHNILCIHLSFVSECRFRSENNVIKSIDFSLSQTAKKRKIYFHDNAIQGEESFHIKIQESGLWQLLESEANNSCYAVTLTSLD